MSDDETREPTPIPMWLLERDTWQPTAREWKTLLARIFRAEVSS